jgi:predicted ATPase
MEQVVLAHADVADAAAATFGGVDVKSTGDGVLAVFADPTAAVLAAVDVQRHAVAMADPALGPVGVRIGIHTGPCKLRRHDVLGAVPNLAARLQSVGHGGQVLLSDVTADALQLPAGSGVEVIGLGPHLLRSFDAPVEVFGVAAPGLRREFPPLRAAYRGFDDLPDDDRELFGRDDDVRRVTELLREHRLVTLWGPAGVGKTRIALRVATTARRPFADGVRFVDLSQAVDAASVSAALLASFRAAALAGEDGLMTLERTHAASRILVLLDGCERARDAVAAVVGRLLRSCRGMHVLATTRQPIDVGIGVATAIRPFAVPGDDASLGALLELPPVQLLAARSAQALPGFDIRSLGAPGIVALCRRADGLPLALELAAARPLTDDRPAPLPAAAARAGGAPQAMADALRPTLDALDPSTRHLFATLAAFAGPFTRSLATDLAATAGASASELDRLVGTALVQRDDSSGRAVFRVLAPLRDVASAHVAGADRDAIARGHARVMLARARHHERELRSERQADAVVAVNAEFADHRLAVETFLATGAIEDAGTLVVALFQHCMAQPRPEGHRWALTVAERLQGDEANGAEVLGVAALSAWYGGDLGRAVELASAAIDRAAVTGGSARAARTALVDALGYAGDVAAAVPHFVALTEQLREDEPYWQVNGLGYEAIGLATVGMATEAERAARRAIDVAAELGNPDCEQWANYALARVLAPGSPGIARLLYEDAMDAAASVGSRFHVTLSLVEWLTLRADEPDDPATIDGARDLLDLLAAGGNRSQLSQAFREVGLLLGRHGHDEVAALALLAHRRLPAMPSSGPAASAAEHEMLAVLRTRLGRSWPGIVERARTSARNESLLVDRCREELAAIRRANA